MRVLRTVPGRRALQLALLVGGLLALGFLCGQQAQAAEGVPSTPSLTSLTSAVPRKAPPPGARKPAVIKAVPVAPVVDGVHEVVRSVTDTVTDTVNSPITSALTETLTETVRQVTELPVVQVPELPVVSEPPVESAPVTPTPGPAQPRTPVTHDAGHDKSRTEKAAAATTAVSYGPRITAVAFASDRAAAHIGGHRAARAVDAPAHPAPTGDPDGVLGKSAVDGSPSRHGDAYAVAFADRALLRLVPGAAARLDAAGTPDRYRDIPVFPG
ncbi:hypothetical protein [Streptomyces sp. NPDC058457]|uniref:hypothetical protein n=1 Tax=Streptomyces sp. NPDC058457 TaxID=3346507 RepID=UPI003658629A